MLFAHLKRILKLDRLRLRGPNGARDEFHLAATAQNLRKLAKLLPMPQLAGVNWAGGRRSSHGRPHVRSVQKRTLSTVSPQHHHSGTGTAVPESGSLVLCGTLKARSGACSALLQSTFLLQESHVPLGFTKV